MISRRKITKYFLWAGIVLFVISNIIAAFHAYKFTHFSPDSGITTIVPENLTAFDKVKNILTGVSVMRPDNYSYPVQKFETVRIQSNKNIECWKINTENSRGTVILFHGYDNSKSSMIGRSNEFIKMGYSTLLVDFMGSGGSEGMQTTIGFKEAEEVKSCYDYARSKGEQNIILFGTSMGAAAILKAIHDYKIIPSDIIIECPFSAIFSAVCNRFEAVNIPIFPLAPILTFWEVWKMVSGFLVSVRLIMPEK